MVKVDHSRVNSRDRMARNGTDCLADDGLPGGLTPPRRRPSKADLRAELAEAMERVTQVVRCQGCGHSAAVAVPPSKARARFRCSRCGEVAR